ncbi:MAG: HEAT repeat domain-containing protein [Rhodococcus sp. (in: high G+C Gram-positive bacteria)]|uniref:hypothetical protein n=1 Tax=Rhodococcus sp. EPR-157 TaxID=1813677 RepID=UPI0007BC10E0|nr:hypothetical protein [Rhodococcus sp. EPR-157]KZF12424.1 hypothetical protein A2J03_17910 [Rhodococcus sp. EPR-157]
MAKVDLTALGYDELCDYLRRESGLPGPRANLTLVDQTATLLPRRTLSGLADEQDEYLAMCGVAGMARACMSQAGQADAELDQLAGYVRDPRWRLREGFVRGLQLAAVDNPTAVAELVHRWVRSPDLAVVRAAVEAICEPRLLKYSEMCAAALDACAVSTTTLSDTEAQPRTDRWRGLEQTLSYAWSVAVAAEPVRGLPMFEALEAAPSPLVRRIAVRNRTKKRLARLL